MYQCDNVPIEQPDLSNDFIRRYRELITINKRLNLFYNVIIKQPDLSKLQQMPAIVKTSSSGATEW